MSSSAINQGVLSAKISNVQNVGDSSAVCSTTGDWSFKNATATATNVFISNAGNVGVGVTPSAWGSIKAIEFAGGASFSADTSSNAFVTSNSFFDGTNWKYKNSASAGNYYVAGNAHVWRIAPLGTAGNNVTWTQAMTLDASGNLLVNTTNNAGNNKVRIAGGTQNGLQVDCSTSTTAGGVEIDVGSNNATQLALQVYSTSNSAVNALIYSNGTFGSRTSTYGGISDIKLKENVVDATSKLEDLCKVRVVNYNLIGEHEKHLGVIAQELENIFPSMVFESPDRDSEGNVLETTTKSVKYSIFIPMLVKAIQELSAKVEEQSSRLEAQAAEIAALKASAVLAPSEGA